MASAASDIADPGAYEKIFQGFVGSTSLGHQSAAARNPLLFVQAMATTGQDLLDPSARIRARTKTLHTGSMSAWVTKGARGVSSWVADRGLLLLILKHVRKYFCDGRKIALKGASAQALCATIAAAIAPLIGLPPLLVIGIVAAVIHFILTVLKGVFCEMTDAKVVTAMAAGSGKAKRTRAGGAKKR